MYVKIGERMLADAKQKNCSTFGLLLVDILLVFYLVLSFVFPLFTLV